jgi:hypothetical protein
MMSVVVRDIPSRGDELDLHANTGLLHDAGQGAIRLGMRNSRPEQATVPRTRRRERGWPRWLNSGLLLIQAILLTIVTSLAADTRLPEIVIRLPAFLALRSEPASLAVAIPSILGILGAIGFLSAVRGTWLLAMAIQAWSLVACLQAYFANRSSIAYPIMLYSILMVLYLNSADVRHGLEANVASHPTEGLLEI